jgi:hypothetical protein
MLSKKFQGSSTGEWPRLGLLLLLPLDDERAGLEPLVSGILQRIARAGQHQGYPSLAISPARDKFTRG